MARPSSVKSKPSTLLLKYSLRQGFRNDIVLARKYWVPEITERQYFGVGLALSHLQHTTHSMAELGKYSYTNPILPASNKVVFVLYTRITVVDTTNRWRVLYRLQDPYLSCSKRLERMRWILLSQFVFRDRALIRRTSLPVLLEDRLIKPFLLGNSVNNKKADTSLSAA